MSSIMQFALLPLRRFTQGGQPIKKSRHERSRESSKSKESLQIADYMLCVVFLMFLWAAVESFPSAFVAVFTDDPQLSQLSCWALRIYMASAGLMGLQTDHVRQTFRALRKLQEEFLFSYLKKDNSADTVYLYLASVYRRQSAGSIPGRAYSRCHRRHNDPFDVLR